MAIIRYENAPGHDRRDDVEHPFVWRVLVLSTMKYAVAATKPGTPIRNRKVSKGFPFSLGLLLPDSRVVA